VVVGSLLDLSNTYYNPGAMSLMTDPSLLLGTSAFELLSLTVSGETFPDRKLQTVTLRPLSSFFAMPVGKSIAISYLNRFTANYSLNSRVAKMTDIVPDLPGDEFLVGEINYLQRLDESWGGVTWSRKVKDNVGVGVSFYGTLRSQSMRSDNFAQAVNQSGAVGASRVVDYNYYSAGLVWKAGIAFDNAPLTWGVSMTTPTLHLFGSGKAFGTQSAFGVDLDGDGVPDPYVIGLEEDGIPATYHSPVSIAAGAQYTWRQWSFYASAEWFNGVGTYQVMDLPPFVVSTAGDTLFLTSETSARAVFNGGVGLEYELSKNFKLYGSFITDYSAATGNPDDLFTTSDWNLFHVSMGSKFRVSKLSLILGLGSAFGNKTFDIPPPEDIPQPLPAESKYRSLKVIVGIQTGT